MAHPHCQVSRVVEVDSGARLAPIRAGYSSPGGTRWSTAGYVGKSTMVPLLHSEVEQFVAESGVTPLHHRCATAFPHGIGCPRCGVSAQAVAGSGSSAGSFALGRDSPPSRRWRIVGVGLERELRQRFTTSWAGGLRWSGAAERERLDPWRGHNPVSHRDAVRCLEHVERLIVKWAGLEENLRRLAGPASHDRLLACASWRRPHASWQPSTWQRGVERASRCFLLEALALEGLALFSEGRRLHSWLSERRIWAR